MTFLEQGMNYDETRKRLETRACLFLAKPVAILLSVVYEPRVDGVNYPASFSNLVGETKDALREGLRTLGSQNGGKIEGFALERAKTLIEAADQIVSNIIQDRSEELISFYKTSVGKKSVKSSQKISQQAARDISEKYDPLIVDFMKKQIRENIEIVQKEIARQLPLLK